NAVIYNNKAPLRGGGITNSISSPVLTNVTIAHNTAGQSAGGMYNVSGSSPIIRNSIIYGNTLSDHTGSDVANNSSTADQPMVSNSLIGGSGGSSSWSTTIGADGGNNSDDDPLFVDAAQGNYSLRAGSPAINAGDNTVFYPGETPDLSAITTDIAGSPRTKGGLIDIGAYEISDDITPDARGIVYVKVEATGT